MRAIDLTPAAVKGRGSVRAEIDREPGDMPFDDKRFVHDGFVPVPDA